MSLMGVKVAINKQEFWLKGVAGCSGWGRNDGGKRVTRTCCGTHVVSWTHVQQPPGNNCPRSSAMLLLVLFERESLQFAQHPHFHTHKPPSATQFQFSTRVLSCLPGTTYFVFYAMRRIKLCAYTFVARTQCQRKLGKKLIRNITNKKNIIFI